MFFEIDTEMVWIAYRFSQELSNWIKDLFNSIRELFNSIKELSIYV